MSEELKINKAYAENYNVWRKKEELQKRKNDKPNLVYIGIYFLHEPIV